jgi:DNA polymerase III subunit gamma/tau
MNHTYFGILSGGAGTRLWPVSREKAPKQFYDLGNSGKSLLIDTVERLKKYGILKGADADNSSDKNQEPDNNAANTDMNQLVNDKNEIYYLYWTGGYDSTFRLCEMLLNEKKIVQPFYVSLARIFARELGTAPVDLYEIDAASHNGVDDIRELRDAVSTLPVSSKYKVYILDEVHMLSKAAFNALLKTLEEPPAHVIFILATTELHKVPETIISRSHLSSFNSPTETLLKDFVIDIAKKEGYAIETDGAELVALLGDGSFRDTHGVLQQVLDASDKKKITVDMVEAVTGVPPYTMSETYIEALLSGNIDASLTQLHDLSTSATSLALLFRRTINLLRLVLLARVSSTTFKSQKDVSDMERDFAKRMIDTYATSITSATLLRMLTWYEKHKAFPDETLALEMALVETKEGSPVAK